MEKIASDRSGVFLVAFADREDTDLFRSQPEREVSSGMFDEDREEPFDRSHDSGMDHDDALVRAFFVHTGEIEAFRHVHIELDGSDLPFSAEGILGHEVELRSVESGFTDAFKRISLLFAGDILEYLFRG